MYSLPSEEEKKSIIFHINVEISTLNECYNKLKIGEDKIAFECFLLHTRNLFDFLNTTTKKHEDDVIAKEIIGNEITTTFPGDTKDRINKQLQHISYSRLSDQRGLYEKRSAIYQSVKDGLEEYNSQASKEYQLNQLV